MYKKWNLFIILVLLLGLVLPIPRQYVSAEASAIAKFTFTSTPNPSNFGQDVTFTLSAEGNDSTYPPFGYVDFFDNGVKIPNCDYITLNFPGGSPSAGNPAICKTSSLAVGTHLITASFSSMVSGIYAHETLTLQNGQTVDDSILLTISPSTLMDAMLTVNYQLMLIASYPGGSRCENCTWSYTSELPDGIGLNAVTGELLGTPKGIGTSTFTVFVDDGNGAHGSQEYTWNVTKVKPVVDVGASTTYVGSILPTTLGALAHHPDPTFMPWPTGKMSFSVDGIPVTGCSGPEAKSTNEWGQAYCTSYLPTGLEAGSYQIQVEFTPDTVSGEFYQVGSGNGTLQINSQPPIQVSGLLFNDYNHDGVKDSDESLRTSWPVFLDHGCDSSTDASMNTDASTGRFTFSGLTIGDTYCLAIYQPLGFVVTANPDLFILDQQKYFEIGIYENWLGFSPNPIPVARIGEFYDQTILVVGGTPPYTVKATIVSPLPAGLTFDDVALRVYGMPTTSGLGEISLEATDSIGSYGEESYPIKVQAEGVFDLTSSVNPSGLKTPVTFTFSGSGDVVDPGSNENIPPFGLVAFYDGDVLIENCEQTILNFNMDTYKFGDYPATCTTSALTEGQHTITASFSYPFGMYLDATRTITQQVGTVEPLTILPETLPEATYGTPFSQWLSGTCAEGYSCGYPQWRLKYGSRLPSGIILEQYGLIQGSPSDTGSFTFTVEAYDVNYSDQSLGTRTYTWNILNVTPKVTFGEMLTYYDYNAHTYKTRQFVHVTHPNSGWSVGPAGLITVSVDGSPVDVCTNLSPIPNMASLYSCVTTDELVGLMPGIHTLHTDFTPDANAAPNYNSASGETTFTNPPRMEGLQFNDLNRNGIRDDGEESGSIGYVQLDRGCDGTYDGGTPADNSGQFSVNITPGEYCVNVLAYGKWYQSTMLEPFTVVEQTYKYFEIGFYESKLTYDPEELPSATAGKNYAQTITISGGVPPYSLISANQDLPGEFKFDITFNETSFTISGSPTTYAEGYVSLDLQDSTGMKGNWNSSIVIKEDGFFYLTSSSNPANQGEEVTFTVSATGDVVYYDSPYPIMGTVTFYADGTPIEGCSDIFLNVDQDWNIGEFPAICKTAGLEQGSHAITATFLDWTGFYNDTTLDLTQVVNTTTFADLSISKTDSKDPVKPGSKLVYALTVSNLGADLAESVIVTDKLDVNTTYLSVSAPRGWVCSYEGNSGTVTCTTDSLKSGSSAIIKITVMVNKTAKVGKELVNNAFVSSTTFDPDLNNNAVVQKTMVVK